MSYAVLSTLLASAVTLAALAGLGRLACGVIDRHAGDAGLLRLPLALAVGWAIAALVSAAGAPFGADQRLIARVVLALGLVSLFPLGAWRVGRASEDVRLLRDLAVTFVLGAPLALLAAGTPAVMYDEFAQWLPNTRYLVEHGAYWRFPDWIGVTAKPGYPNGTTVIALLASEIAGPGIEGYFKTFMVLVMASFGLVLAFVAGAAGAVLPRLLSLGVLVALANPFFDPRIALTCYADASTGFLLALAGIAAAAGVGAAPASGNAAVLGWFARSGCVCGALVMQKSTNVVLVAALALASSILVTAAKQPRGRQVACVALLLGPPVAGWAVWQAYLHTAAIGPDLVFRPLATWDWHAPGVVLGALLVDRLRDNPWLGGTALAAAILGFTLLLAIRGRMRPHVSATFAAAGVLLTMAAVISGCFVAFLAVAYVGFFSPGEVAQAGSAWRYLTELGPLLVAALTSPIATWAAHAHIRPPARVLSIVGLLMAVLVLCLPVLAREHYALDCRYPDVVATRLVTTELAPSLADFTPTATKRHRLAVVHPTMGDWLAHAIAYDLGWPTIDVSIQYHTRADDDESAEEWAWDAGAEALLDLSALDRPVLADTRMVPAIRLATRPQTRGAPWAILATTAAQPLPRCGLGRSLR